MIAGFDNIDRWGFPIGLNTVPHDAENYKKYKSQFQKEPLYCRESRFDKFIENTKNLTFVKYLDLSEIQCSQLEGIREPYIYPIFFDIRLCKNIELIHLPDKVKKDVQENRAKILFYDQAEGNGLNTKQYIPFLKTLADLNKFKYSNLGFVDNDYLTPTYHNQTYGFYHNYFESSVSVDGVLNHKHVEYRFVCKNRSAKLHRELLTSFFYENPQIDVAWSYLYDPKENGWKKYHEKFTIPEYKSFKPSQHYYNCLPKKIELNKDDIEYTNLGLVPMHCATQNLGYIDIVTETFFFNEFFQNDLFDKRIFLSEKTFKPISMMQPFLILGDAGSLEVLHNMGYKLFIL